ncbi:hypothetical protein DY000_02012255 [Brassica cretica]|uniref:RNase H type-1 domain-containing protein n=1 Tax=Brassica cretica TaxID=69181 RepID=A0ABQ7CTB3_BRACR|nr:hypothetical protein DY000_02012255 [Brassica cretica]
MPEETTLCNTDAAWNPSSREAGLGWIFSTHETSTFQGLQFQTHVQSAITAEALAVRAALTHTIHLDVIKIWLRSDSLGLIRAIASVSKPKNLHGILLDIEALSSSFSFCCFSFTPRESNGLADSVAKASLCNMNPLGSGPRNDSFSALWKFS